MENEHIQNDYRTLQTTALQALKNPNTLGVMPAHTSILRLWHYSAFESALSWMICHSATPLTFVRQVTWEQITDQERSLDRLQGSPERFVDRIKHTKEGTYSRPTLLIKDFSIETVQYQPYVSEFAQHAIPALVPDYPPLGMDGAFSGIETSSFGNTRLSLEWWGDGPHEWKAVIATAQRLRQFLSQHASR